MAKRESNSGLRGSFPFLGAQALRLAVLALAALAASRCHDTVTGPPLSETPTPLPPTPASPSPTATPPPPTSTPLPPTPTPRPPTPTPTPFSGPNVAGKWSGTFHDVGSTEGSFCPGRDQSVVVDIVQSGPLVSFRLPLGTTGCSGPGDATFEGGLSGSQLTGEIRKEVSGTDCLLRGRVQGTVEPARIVLDGSLAGRCNAVRIHVELHR